MRDLETISLALTCAELGILVFGTLHTNSAPKTIDRIINAFPADQQGQTRTAVEILIGSPALANMIREGKFSQIDSLIQTGSTSGMQSMDEHLKQLIEEGEITREAAYEKAIDKNLFA